MTILGGGAVRIESRKALPQEMLFAFASDHSQLEADAPHRSDDAKF
jgi:hypothetical protein